ncbi:MAG: hypothetical protein CSA49_06255 [Gammaproteobacteria bacterium]|nr:MAG: hypothetical protein CSA49_06255 [Gammaproteobacteria bacterium]
MKPHNPDSQNTSIEHLVHERQRLARASRFLDTAFTLPVLKIKVGFDALIGLIPVAGDIIGGLLSLYFIQHAIRLRMPARLILKMLINIAVDLLIGLVPIFGDLFDISWRANLQNYQLIDQHLAKKLKTLGYQSTEPCQDRPASILIPLLLCLLALLALYIMRQPLYDYLSTFQQYLYNHSFWGLQI